MKHGCAADELMNPYPKTHTQLEVEMEEGEGDPFDDQKFIRINTAAGGRGLFGNKTTRGIPVWLDRSGVKSLIEDLENKLKEMPEEDTIDWY